MALEKAKPVTRTQVKIWDKEFYFEGPDELVSKMVGALGLPRIAVVNILEEAENLVERRQRQPILSALSGYGVEII